MIETYLKQSNIEVGTVKAYLILKLLNGKNYENYWKESRRKFVICK